MLSNATVDRIAELVPNTTSELESVSGVGPATIEQFGYDILELIRSITSDPELNGNSDGESATPNESDAASRKTDGDSENPHSIVSESNDEFDLEADSETTADTGPDDVNKADNTEKAFLRVDEGANILAPSPAPSGSRNSAQKAPKDQNAPKDIDQSDCYWTWRLLSDGYSFDQIVAIRGRSVGAILQDLADAAAQGHEIRPEWTPQID